LRDCRLGNVHVLLRRQLVVAQLAHLLQSRKVGARFLESRNALQDARFGRRKRALRLEHLRFQARGVELRRGLARFHLDRSRRL
jgi:hypothetical protein